MAAQPARPAPGSTRVVSGHQGVPLAVHFLGGEGPPVMLAHATGFHGHCWEPAAARMTGSFSVWALDQRGHGESGKAPGRRYDWADFAYDLLSVVDELSSSGAADRDDWRIGGHSLGGGVALLAEARRPGTFRAITCYEPVVLPPGGPAEVAAGSGPANGGPAFVAPPNPLADLARRRRPRFDSKEAALANYSSKPPFAAFHPDALRAYVDHGLVEDPAGGVILACDRDDEAAVFDAAATAPTWQELPAVRAPVAVLSGAPPELLASVAPMVAKRLPRGGHRRFDDLDHFGPMTAPELVGDTMAAALRLPGDR